MSTNHTPTLAGVAAALRTAHESGGLDPYDVLARMLTPAGALSEWDSETIENVLEPAQDALDAAGLPWVGDTGVQAASHRFWAQVAHDAGWQQDWWPYCPDCGALLDDGALALDAHRSSDHPDD
ncbi:hypothetical protein Xcel_3391 (plasmid) [Xylanimonas cellulosilytica DSM 15894]|uniref:Uncharacterized protein n=1 Tax=Xylanimonas cellulosilytica (strain DSM 15894 / JCM 12276 / CECT 5975 / KCTC 9989 / LMG 20990 / NBRC 107835 / XIL07) TaxID=446471 RepID=D1C0S4_XYLCX|nr:hypothetical protein [Xylanimonas cellulosilytica]ACZ32390.1 hypothetical protein Xcel_3391 [Xylanimonas cellulosilytica DSM 15894]